MEWKVKQLCVYAQDNNKNNDYGLADTCKEQFWE